MKWEREQDDIEAYEGDEIAHTRKLLRQARHLRVPVPPVWNADGTETEHWNRSQVFGEHYLGDLGQVKLRDAIRQELAWRQQTKGHWIAWVSAFTGLIGALTGLLAVYFSR